jgi:hypothetical protein
MKLLKGLLFAVVLIAPLVAHAGLTEKIAKMKAEEQVEVAREALVVACGNTELTVNFDWSSYDNYDYKVLGREQFIIMGWAGSLAEKTLDDVSKVCKDEEYGELYKEEVKKITNINFSGNPNQSQRDSIYSLDDENHSLNVLLTGQSTYNLKNADLVKGLW